jgi:hypothetical protein
MLHYHFLRYRYLAPGEPGRKCPACGIWTSSENTNARRGCARRFRGTTPACHHSDYGQDRLPWPRYAAVATIPRRGHVRALHDTPLTATHAPTGARTCARGVPDRSIPGSLPTAARRQAAVSGAIRQEPARTGTNRHEPARTGTNRHEPGPSGLGEGLGCSGTYDVHGAPLFPLMADTKDKRRPTVIQPNEPYRALYPHGRNVWP